MNLADIITGDGFQITQIAWRGKCNPYQLNYYRWPRQGNPSEAVWMEWRSTLRKALEWVKELKVNRYWDSVWRKMHINGIDAILYQMKGIMISMKIDGYFMH